MPGHKPKNKMSKMRGGGMTMPKKIGMVVVKVCPGRYWRER